MKLREALAIFVALALFLNGCTPAFISLDKEQLSRLKEQQEIVAVHYQLPAPTTGGSPGFPPPTPSGGPAYGIVILIWLLIYGATAAIDKTALESHCWTDPITDLQERFVSAMQSGAGLENVRSMEAPHSQDDIEYLRKLYGNAWVIDFKTIGCERASDAPAPSSFSARSRLIRLEDSSIIWQGVCASPKTTRQDTTEAATPDDPVKACDDQLLAHFFAGKQDQAAPK